MRRRRHSTHRDCHWRTRGARGCARNHVPGESSVFKKRGRNCTRHNYIGRSACLYTHLHARTRPVGTCHCTANSMLHTALHRKQQAAHSTTQQTACCTQHCTANSMLHTALHSKQHAAHSKTCTTRYHGVPRYTRCTRYHRP